MSELKQAELLYQIVPAVYRNRDQAEDPQQGHLKKYFRGVGLLFDQIQATLEQKLADNFVDRPINGDRSSQEWLLPYFADLLDVRLVSPLVSGKREEIANAVRWRQGKGTLKVVEEIAQAIGQFEVVVQEGWQRVATTARVDIPRIPSINYGYLHDIPQQPPRIAARHPGLNAVTPDFSCPSGAVKASLGLPGSEQSTVDGETSVWRQASFHGAPCHPGSFEDVSRRSVDFRSPVWNQGHYHPARLLLFVVPPAGFFPDDLQTVNWSDGHQSEAFLELIDVIEEDSVTTYQNKTWNTEAFQPVRVRRVIKLGQVPSGVGDPDFHCWRFRGLVLDNTVEVDKGRIELDTCAARKIEVHSIDQQRPVITARSCLFKKLQAARGLTQLEYCTVLDTTLTEVIRASDCIFTGAITKDHPSPAAPDNGCLRYSRVAPGQLVGGMHYFQVVEARAIFYSGEFGHRGCAVLHPAIAAAISRGAEDKSEMGAYHDRYYSLLMAAVADKLKDYCPLGMEPVVIPDERLLSLSQL